MAQIEKVSVLAANLGAAVTADLREVTATQFSRKQYVFPMSDTEFNESFPSTIAVFTDRGPTANGGVVTNMVISNQVACPFLLTGVSVTVIPDTVRASIEGAVVSLTQPGFTLGQTPAWSDILATTNQLIGPLDAVPLVNPLLGNAAILKWGSCSQDFAQAFSQAYNMRFLLGCKWEVFDEPLSNMVTFDGQAGLTDGSGASGIDMAAVIRKANDRAIALLAAPFFPRTIEQSPSFLNANTARAILAPAPIAPENTGSVSWKNDGNGFFALDLPILLTPYTTIMMEMHNNTGDLVYYPRMRQEATLAVDGAVQMASNATTQLSGAVVGTTGGLIMLRKYGTLSVMTTLHGFNLESAAVSDYANQVASGGFSSYLKMYSGDQMIAPMIRDAQKSKALEGLPKLSRRNAR